MNYAVKIVLASIAACSFKSIASMVFIFQFKHNFHGVIHEFIPNKKIIRTFEMASAPFGPQLEFLEFEKMDGQTSRLTMQVIYKSASIKDQQLKLPFAQGLSMAHDRIEELMKKSK